MDPVRKPYRPPRMESLEPASLLEALGPAQASVYVFDATPLGPGPLGAPGGAKTYHAV